MSAKAPHTAARILAARAWPVRAALAAVLGALAVLGLPDFYFFPILLISFSGLLLLLDAAKRMTTAILAGWWFGLGYFAAGLYWVVHPFYVDAAQHAWMAPFALVGLAAGMALYPALAAGLAWRFAAPGFGRLVALGLFWFAAELLRGWAFTGFAWNLIGTTWTASPAMMQSAAVIGVYGLGFITVIAAACPALLAIPARPAIMVLAAAAVGLGGLWGVGNWWLDQPMTDRAENVHLRIVQPNVAQNQKWLRENRAAILDDLVSLSLQSGDRMPDLVIWPETAVPFFLEENPDALQAVGAAAGGGHVITGTPRRRYDADNKIQLFNSAAAVNGLGLITATYDKSHLVPFGEYLPLRPLLEPLGVAKLVQGRIDYQPGPGDGRLGLPGLPVAAPLICYEVIFPHEVAAGPDRPDWLLNITNDAWFGDTSGPPQHLAAARFRSVEQGLPLVRAANTGISALIDAKGRLLQTLPLNSQGIIDAPLPPALQATPYSRFGSGILAGLFILGLAVAGWAGRRR